MFHYHGEHRMSHIRDLKEPSHAWCGTEINDTDFNFKDVNQVIYNRLYDSKYEVCSSCLKQLIDCLED